MSRREHNYWLVEETDSVGFDGEDEEELDDGFVEPVEFEPTEMSETVFEGNQLIPKTGNDPIGPPLR